MPYDHYQSVKELADRLKVAEATVRHWIKTGELRAIDIGKGWRIADADLQQFIRRRETAPRLQKRGIRVLGVGFNPLAVRRWRELGLKTRFGAAADMVLEPFQDAADRAVELLCGAAEEDRTDIPKITTEGRIVT
jgi:excisionase family DNA binding protein